MANLNSKTNTGPARTLPEFVATTLLRPWDFPQYGLIQGFIPICLQVPGLVASGWGCKLLLSLGRVEVGL